MVVFNRQGNPQQNPNSKDVGTNTHYYDAPFPFDKIKMNDYSVGGNKTRFVETKYPDPVNTYAQRKTIKSAPFGGAVLSNQ